MLWVLIRSTSSGGTLNEYTYEYVFQEKYKSALDDDDDDEFRFNDASTHEGHLRQNGELTWFCNERL